MMSENLSSTKILAIIKLDINKNPALLVSPFHFYVRSLLFFRFKEISSKLFLDILLYSFHTSYYKQRLWRESLGSLFRKHYHIAQHKAVTNIENVSSLLVHPKVFLLRGNSNTRNVFFRVANKTMIETQLLKNHKKIIRLSYVNNSVC